MLLALAAGAAIAVGLDHPAFIDYEGRYAEVAREMLLSGDWITPHLDGTLFLNKPPLLYWLAAAGFGVFGLTEWVRLVSIAAAVVTVLATSAIGTRCWGARTGLVAGAFLATMLGFVLEARKLRPDSLLMAAVTVAVLCGLAATTAAPVRGTRWWAAMGAALGVGVLAKGLVAVVLVAPPVAVALLRAGQRPSLRACAAAAVVFALVVLPWHVAASWRHPGFAWDYVVNQHLLFFADRKFPRDSEGVPLAVFWGVFLARVLPWGLLLPLVAREAVAGVRRDAPPDVAATAMLGAWVAGVLCFFSAAPARLEHYTVPALPAVALLAARGWERLRAGAVGGWGWAWLGACGSVLLAGGIVGLTRGGSLLARWPASDELPGLTPLVVPAATTAALAGLLALAAARRRRPAWIAAGLAVAVALGPIVVLAEAATAPLLSWKPVADLLAEDMPADSELIFEAPDEYQLVGGLAFYTRRRVLLIEPPGFVLPTYLEGRRREIFVARDDFERRWQAGERFVFVSNLQRRRTTPEGMVPPPFRVLGRVGTRWLLTNVPADVAEGNERLF